MKISPIPLHEAINLLKEVFNEFEDSYGMKNVTKKGFSTRKYDDSMSMIMGRVNNIISYCPELQQLDSQITSNNNELFLYKLRSIIKEAEN